MYSTKYYCDDQVKDDKMDRLCVLYMGGEKGIQAFGGEA